MSSNLQLRLPINSRLTGAFWSDAFVKTKLHVSGDLNRDILGPPGDGKIIVISDSDDEDETHEDAVINAEAAPPSAANSADSPTSASDVDETPDGVSDDNADSGDEAGSP
jgi:hypothetical protein